MCGRTISHSRSSLESASTSRRSSGTSTTRARSVDDVTHELQGLRAEIEAKREEFDAEQSRAAELVEERLDDTLRAVFRKYEHELPGELAGLDADLERVVAGFLTAIGVTFDRSEIPGRVVLHIHP